MDNPFETLVRTIILVVMADANKKVADTDQKLADTNRHLTDTRLTLADMRSSLKEMQGEIVLLKHADGLNSMSS